MSPPSPKHESGDRARSRGFTLLEILVVLVIAGLAAGVLAPRLVGGLRGGEEATIESLAQALVRARSAAIARAEPVIFEPPRSVLRFGVRVTGGPITIFPDGSSDGARISVARTQIGLDGPTGRIVVTRP